MTETITSNKLLLVEGQDENNFFNKLLNVLEINDVNILEVGGCNNFKNKYPSTIIRTGFSEVNKLGFVRDAEQNPANSAFSSICHIISKYTPKIPLPSKPGEIVRTNDFYCGIYIMPDNSNAGMLEDLCLASISDEEIYKYVDNYIKMSMNLMTTEDQNTYNISKAKIQTYLASKASLPRNLGIAAQQGKWDFSKQTYVELISFLTQLYKDN